MHPAHAIVRNLTLPGQGFDWNAGILTLPC
jgi:hypothetical protein